MGAVLYRQKEVQHFLVAAIKIVLHFFWFSFVTISSKFNQTLTEDSKGKEAYEIKAIIHVPVVGVG